MFPRHLRGLLRHGFIVQVGHMLAGTNTLRFSFLGHIDPFNLLWHLDITLFITNKLVISIRSSKLVSMKYVNTHTLSIIPSIALGHILNRKSHALPLPHASFRSTSHVIAARVKVNNLRLQQCTNNQQTRRRCSQQHRRDSHWQTSLQYII
jgi:hypothetical protein